MNTESRDLNRRVRSGLLWSILNNVLLRLAGLGLGIIIARILEPESFGIYAVALTVQTVLMTVADFGLSADLIRAKDPETRAPTVATLGILTGLSLCALMAATSQEIAELLGSGEAASVIAVLSLTLLLGGAGVVPYAMLQRSFAQKKLFVVAAVDLLVSATVTVSLISAGWGPMSLAIGRIAAQGASLLVQYILSGVRPVYGFRKDLAASVLSFGVPVAGANLLSWGLLGLDKVIIARQVGALPLGYYVLAFNISTWPMTAIGQVVRSVALPGFARISGARRDVSLATATAPTLSLSLLAGTLLCALASPLVSFVYGERWSPAAHLLVPLALFGVVRVVYDLMASYALARGASTPLLAVQIVWFVALAVTLAFATGQWGVDGAGWAQLVVAVVVVLPAYLLVLKRKGADIRAVGRAAWPPILTAPVVGVLAWLAASRLESPLGALAAGVAVGLGTFALLQGPWLYRRLRDASALIRSSRQTGQWAEHDDEPEPACAPAGNMD